MVISSEGMTCRRPSTNLAPPVPPVSTQIMRPSPLSRGLHGRRRLEVFLRADQIAARSLAGIQDRPARPGGSDRPYFQSAVARAPDAANLSPACRERASRE